MSRPFAISWRPAAGIAAVVVASLGPLAAGALVVLAAGPARANGAFPESFQIVLPVDRPQQIVLGTNFGLIISDDDGATWTWTCEQKATQMGALYGVSAPPLDRFFSASPLVGLAYSDDASCTWTAAGGALDSVLATDYFADPTNPMRVYAMGGNPDDSTVPLRVYSSDDGGQTFGTVLFTAPAGLSLSGLESARSAPMTIYLASYTTGFHPYLQRSMDGGATWKQIDVSASIGDNDFRIIAVDPSDPSTISIRVIEQTGESLAISRDGGMTFTKMFTIAGQLTSYARLDSGTIVVSGLLAIDGVGYRSTDGGKTFTDWVPRTTNDAGVPDVASDGGVPRPPHLEALAARGGKLYAAAKNFSDDWAVGVSTDEGLTFERLTRYDQVSAIRACAQTSCLSSCESQAGAQIWPLSVCGVPNTTMTPPPASKGGGCALVAGGGSGSAAALAAAGLATLLAVARSRRRRR